MSQGSEQAWRAFLSMIDRAGGLSEEEGHRCPYLPGREARNRVFLAERFDGELYQVLMDRGFRRSGKLFYQPICRGCRECKAIRVPVSDFRPSRSQRRAWRRNADTTVTVGRPELTREKHELFMRYLSYQHDGSMGHSREDLRRFLYDSPVQTLEFCYRVGNRLVGVGIGDVSSKSLSSVYLMFDPAEARRSLGVYSALWEIAWCRREKIPYYYFGFYIRDCRRMMYKVNYRPCEVLGEDGLWRPFEEAPGGIETRRKTDADTGGGTRSDEALRGP